jgi:hypothetical protein
LPDLSLVVLIIWHGVVIMVERNASIIIAVVYGGVGTHSMPLAEQMVHHQRLKKGKQGFVEFHFKKVSTSSNRLDAT